MTNRDSDPENDAAQAAYAAAQRMIAEAAKSGAKRLNFSGIRIVGLNKIPRRFQN